MTSGSQAISVTQSSGMEEEVDIPEPDEAEVIVDYINLYSQSQKISEKGRLLS